MDSIAFPTVQGFLNLNKPSGWTSHDCVARVRRLLRQKRVGHAGTLDPAATGVLPIAVGTATRLLQYLPSDKAYRATIRFGVTTTTDDLDGEVLHTAVPNLTLAQIQAQLPQFLGKIAQIPPQYSAIQVQGQRLYDLARRGERVEVPVREVEVYRLDIGEWRPEGTPGSPYPELVVDIACGAGTYIRAIARDLGAVLGVGATLATLERTASSGFSLAESLTLETLAQQVEGDRLILIPPIQVLSHLPAISLSAQSAYRWSVGQRLAPPDYSPQQPGIYRVHAEDGTLLGIGIQERKEGEEVLKPKLVLTPLAKPLSSPLER